MKFLNLKGHQNCTISSKVDLRMEDFGSEMVKNCCAKKKRIKLGLGQD